MKDAGVYCINGKEGKKIGKEVVGTEKKREKIQQPIRSIGKEKCLRSFESDKEKTEVLTNKMAILCNNKTYNLVYNT
jgi:hypothetical protein